MTANKSTQGLTIIELLISMVLLGVLMTAILAPLTGLFQMTGQSTQTLNATTQAQEIMEYIQGQWRSYPPARNPDPQEQSDQEKSNVAAQQRSISSYAQTCVTNLPSARDGLEVTVSVWELDNSGNEVRTLNLRQSCSGAGGISAIPMKRVNVSVTTNDPNNSASLTVDLPNP